MRHQTKRKEPLSVRCKQPSPRFPNSLCLWCFLRLARTAFSLLENHTAAHEERGALLSPGYITRAKRGNQNFSCTLGVNQLFKRPKLKLSLQIWGANCLIFQWDASSLPQLSLLTCLPLCVGLSADGWYRQRDCFLDVPSTSMSQRQISSEDGRCTLKYMTGVPTGTPCILFQ